MADTREIIVNALTAAGAAGLVLAGGHHEESAEAWDGETYPLATYAVHGGIVRTLTNNQGGPRLQERTYTVLIELQERVVVQMDDSDFKVAQANLATYRVALEKALIPSKIQIPIVDIALLQDSKPIFLKKDGGGALGVVALAYEVMCRTFEGYPETLVTPTTPTPISEDIFDE